MEHGMTRTRRAKTLLLALAMLLSCCVLPSDRAQAVEKELSSGTVDVIRWHRGLPPQDGEWYRVILSNGTRFFRGNDVKQCDDYSGSLKSVLKSTYRWRTVGSHNWNHYDKGQFVDMPRDETLLTAFGLDLSKDTFYTNNFMNTPALRFNGGGGSAGNGFEPLRGGAPCYDIRLCDWSEGDGKLTDTTLYCAPYSGSLFGEILGETINAVIKAGAIMVTVFGGPVTWAGGAVAAGTVMGMVDSAGHAVAELFGDNLRTMVAAKGLDVTTPWAFIGNEHDDEVDEGKYVVSIKADHLSGLFHDIYLEYPNTLFTCVFGLYGTWAGSEEYDVYWGESVHIDSIGVNEVIDNGTVVNLNAAANTKNFLRIAPGATLTVADGGVLSVGAGVFNEGTIKVLKGGTMIVKDNAMVLPKEFGQKFGNIVLDGGDLVVMPGAKVELEGASGLMMCNDAHLVNYGVIITRAQSRLWDSVVQNYGAIYVDSWVKPENRGAFMDWEVQVDSDGGSARWPGMTGASSIPILGRENGTAMVGYQSVWTGNYVNAAS